MMKGFPDLMKELLDFVAAQCPGMLVHITCAADFDPEVSFPPGPTEAQVNKQERAEHLPALPRRGQDVVGERRPVSSAASAPTGRAASSAQHRSAIARSEPVCEHGFQ